MVSADTVRISSRSPSSRPLGKAGGSVQLGQMPTVFFWLAIVPQLEGMGTTEFLNVRFRTIQPRNRSGHHAGSIRARQRIAIRAAM